MNRRGFIGALSAVLTGAVLDPEKLLWHPGARTIFIPPARLLIPPQELIREMLITLQNNLMLAKATRGEYGKFFHDRGEFKIGDTLNIRVPRAFIGRCG